VPFILAIERRLPVNSPTQKSSDLTINDCLTEIIKFRDKFGLITNESKDSGDCAHNTGIYYTYIAYLGSLTEYHTAPSVEFWSDLKKLSVGPGQYVRHPDPDKWYSKLKYMSRDQLGSLINAMCYFGMNDKVQECYLELKSRNWLHWNIEESDLSPEGKVVTKIADPLGVNQIRCFIVSVPSLAKFKWLLPILDLDLIYAIYFDRWDSDIKLFSQFLTIGKTGTHTFVSKLAEKLYKRKEDAAQKIEDAYCVQALKVAPIGWIGRKAFLQWKGN
jgi:hypothetical protein